MNRIGLFAAIVVSSSASAGLGACVSSSNAPPSGSPDAGSYPGTDATVPFDSSPGTDSSPPPLDAGSDAPVSCASWTPVVLLDASASDGAALSTASSTGAALPGPAPTTCGEGLTPARLLVFNTSPCPIDVWWSDQACEEDFYGTVSPGESWHVGSSSGALWRLRAGGSEELLDEIVLPGAIDDAGVAPTTTIEYPPSAAAPDAAAFSPAPEGTDAAACVPWDADVEYDAAGADAAPVPLENDAGTVPGPISPVCSLVGDEPYLQLFVNNAPCPVDIYFVDYGCNEVEFVTVDPGQTNYADTFATNVWRVRATGSGELLAQVPVVAEGADAGVAVFRYP